MDDPWSTSGPVWSTPAKASSSSQDEKIKIMDTMQMKEPPVSLEVNDPWGTAAVHPQAEVQSKSEYVNHEPLAVASGWGYEGAVSGWAEGSLPQAKVVSHLETTVELDNELIPPRRLSEQATGGWGQEQESPAVELESPHPSVKDYGSATSVPLPTSPPPPAGTPPRNTSSANLPSMDEVHHSPHILDSFKPRTTSLSISLDHSGFRDEQVETFPSPKLPGSASFGEFGAFSEGFGGHTGGDPWGGGGDTSGTTGFDVGEREGWGGGTMERKDSGFSAHVSEEAEEGDGWGGVRSRPISVPQATGGEYDWEEAQRKIRIKEERAPLEKITSLQNDWKEVAVAVIGLDKVIQLNEEEEARLESAVKKLTDDLDDTLKSLSTIPSNINTYAPVLSSLSTHKEFITALARPNPSPSTSLLTLAPTKRSRQSSTFGLGTGSEPSWHSRSQLGEPDAVSSTVQTTAEESGKSGWSFWKKNAQTKPLVTSGGGILEIKTMSPDGHVPGPSTPVGSIDNRGSTSRTASIISPQISRPASPAVSLSAAQSQQPEDSGHAAPSEALNGAAAPSAVSRFFGRLSRKPSSQRNVDVDAKDMELSADDFSFLEEVPSITSPPIEKGVGDLLSLEGDLLRQPANLETVLSNKPVTLPSPLAPPRGPGGASYSRSASNSSATNNRFIARMKAPVPVNDFDLLGGLDFDGDAPSGTLSSAAVVTSPVNTANSSAWDDFLASGRSTTPPVPGPPVIALPPKATPLSRLPSIPPPKSFTPPPTLPALQPKAVPDNFGDFEDFTSAPSNATDLSFDDFGDFSTFTPVPSVPAPLTTSLPRSNIPTFENIMQPSATPPPPPPIAKSPPAQKTSTPLNLPKPQTQSSIPLINQFSTPLHSRPSPLDHTPTLSLVAEASSSRGRRWPAPPSPIAPTLEPPPKAGNSTISGFPFHLSPPPAGSNYNPNRSASATSDLRGSTGGEVGLNINMSQPVTTTSHVMLPPINPTSIQGPLSVPGISPLPSKPATPVNAPAKPSLAAIAPATNGGKPGLSAQDLSFFDSL